VLRCTEMELEKHNHLDAFVSENYEHKEGSASMQNSSMMLLKSGARRMNGGVQNRVTLRSVWWNSVIQRRGATDRAIM
jgi:hypothetical protein